MDEKMKSYRWAVLGCGDIANQLARAMKKEGKALYGVANRTYKNAVCFAQKYEIPKIYENIQNLVTDDLVDIVYIATPNNTHSQYITEALKHGKHVLCEKAITLNSTELAKAKRLAEEQRVILAEAMTVYHMPLYKKLSEMMQAGQLGSLKMIQASFGSYKDYDMNNRFFNPALAGGALLDIGVYALSFIRWFMSAPPDHVLSQVKFAPSGVDEQAGILLMNPAGEMAAATLALHAKQPKRGVLSFDQCCIEIYEYPRAVQAVITYTSDGSQKTIACGNPEDALSYEIRHMEQAVSGKANEMRLDYTSDVMSIMTNLRKQWGFSYPEET